MNIPYKNKIKNSQWSLSIILGITTLFIQPTAKAVIPYIYEPKPESLEKTSLKIARTAAHLLAIGQPKESAKLAEIAVKLKPKNENLWSLLSEAQLRSNQLDKAISSLAKAKELNPEKASLWFAEASIALQQKRPVDAESFLKTGLNLDSKNAIAYFQLGNANIMQTKPKQALKAFIKASQLKPNFWEAINNESIILFELGQKNNAIKKWRKVLEIEKNAEPMLALAAALNDLNPKNKESIVLAKEALSKNPNYVLSTHQEEQLWGNQLRTATTKLLSKPELQESKEKALANADSESFY